MIETKSVLIWLLLPANSQLNYPDSSTETATPRW